MVKVITPQELKNGKNSYQDKFLFDTIDYINESLERSVNYYGFDLENQVYQIELSGVFLSRKRYPDLIKAFNDAGWVVFIICLVHEDFGLDTHWSVATDERLESGDSLNHFGFKDTICITESIDGADIIKNSTREKFKGLLSKFIEPIELFIIE